MRSQIISFHCVLKDKLGNLISSSYNNDVTTHEENQNGLLTGLTRKLRNLTAGDRRKIHLAAKDAYGLYDPQLVMKVSRKNFAAKDLIAVGSQIFMESSNQDMKMFRIVEMDDSEVTLDGNHPLAGQDLVFDIRVTDSREVLTEENDAEFVHAKHGMLH